MLPRSRAKLHWSHHALSCRALDELQHVAICLTSLCLCCQEHLMSPDLAVSPISLEAATSPCPKKGISPCHTSPVWEDNRVHDGMQKPTTFQLLPLDMILAAKILFLKRGG